MKVWLSALLFAASLVHAGIPSEADLYLWLENIDSAPSLDWVRARNQATATELETQPGFAELRARLLTAFESRERIPYVEKIGNDFYNYWRDAEHVRGIWRRTSLEEYRKAVPAWDVVLDLDDLATSEHENWIWQGADCLRPQFERCLISLSRGGSDAVVIREFDLSRKEWVASGFQLPEGKHSVEWRTHDELFVGTNFGPGSLTSSGYPRLIKLWQRGTPLSSAKLLFAGKVSDVSVQANVALHPGSRHELLLRSTEIGKRERWLLEGQKLTHVDLPTDASMFFFHDQLLVQLRSDWTVKRKQFPSGALLAIDWREFSKGQRDFQFLYVPSPRGSLASVQLTLNSLIVNELDNVRSKLYTLNYDQGRWLRTPLRIPSDGVVGIEPVDEFASDDFFLAITDFVTPNSLYLSNALNSRQPELLKRLPAFFEASDVEVTQREAVSKDGTRVPYFMVAKRNLVLDGNNPTLMLGYGGFEISSRPQYGAAEGIGWIERGGVYILANIRGGGEFGPKWHQAALKENRQRAFEDFIAVAEDLIARKVTSPKHLGITGRSNGGLLVGVMLTQRPDLFGAVVSTVPLLDMRRYTKLLAGASWIGEYGDPDNPNEWAFIGRYSPYQNVKKETNYPPVLFTTSTRDDRVHPGHARKMAAKMLDQGHDVLYYENTEGGHGGVANNAQQAYVNALVYSFLWKELARAP